MSLWSFSVHRPVATTMMIGFLVVMGAFSYSKIPLDLVPRVEFPVVTILTVYAGAGPEEIENLVTDKIEDAISSISGIDDITSNSLEGVSQVIINFEEDVDQDVAAQDVREKIDLVLADLPEDAEKPKILKLDINASAVVEVAVFGNRSVGELTRYVEDEVQDELTKVPGAAAVDMIGGVEREIRVSVDERRLAAYGLSLMGLTAQLSQKSLEIPGGRVIKGAREWTVRLRGKFTDVAQIQAIEVRTGAGGLVRLDELAEIRDTFEQERQRARYNGQPAVLLAVKKRSDANSTLVAALLREQVARIGRRMPKGMSIEIYKDRSVFIVQSLDELKSNLVVGVLLTGLILFVFLHDLRSTLIAALAMPASIVATFLLVYMAGFTLNILTLMAIAITVGILVNNAIVVLENVTRKIEDGSDPYDAAVSGTGGIAVAVAGATLTNVVVFVPIGFMSGLVGQFFKSFGLTASFATLVSLLFSFTLTPMLVARLVRKSPGGKGWFASAFDNAYSKLESSYKNDLPGYIDHPFLVISLCLVLLFSVFQLTPFIGFEFMAENDEGEFMVKLRRPAGSSLDSTAAACREVEAIIRKRVPELRRLATKVGKVDAMVGASEGVELGQVTAYLCGKREREHGVREIMERLRNDLAGLVDTFVSLEVPGMVGSKGPPLQVEVLGAGLDQVTDFAGKLKTGIEKVPGAVDVQSTWLPGRPEVRIVPDRVRCQQAGVSVAFLARAVRGRYAGFTPVTYREGSNEYDVRVQLSSRERRSLEKISNLQMITPGGSIVPVRDLALIKPAVGPSRIVRKDRKKAVVITGYVKDRGFGEVLDDVKAMVARLQPPAGIEIRYKGDAKRMRESNENLRQAFILAVILTYMLLSALLESFVYPLLILVSLPLAFVGILPALFICGMRIALFPLMAVVMLVGIVVNNGILIIENVNEHRNRGDDLRKALLEGTSERLRPIIMTTAAAALAMVPLALGRGVGGEMRAPMAVVSIGGLIVSAVLSLIVIPTLFYQWEKNFGVKNVSVAAVVILVAVTGLFVPGPLGAAGGMEAWLADTGLEELAVRPGPSAVDLGSCVENALEHNLLIKASAKGLDSARAARRAAGESRFGKLYANISRIHYNEDMQLFTRTEEETTKSLNFEVPLYTGGSIRSAQRSSSLGVLMATQERERARQDLAFSVVKAYLGLVKAQWLEVLSREHKKALGLQLETVQARIDAGAAVDSERLRVEVALSEAQERIIRYKNGRRRAAAALNLAMGSPLEREVRALDPPATPGVNDSLAQGYARVELHRPEYLIARAAVRVRREAVTAARAALLPSVGLAVTYGDASPFFAGDNDSTQVLLSAEIPIYKAGKRPALERARRDYEQERLKARYLLEQLRFQVKQTWLDVEEARERVDVTRHSLASAAENARIMNERYASGTAIVLEIVDAEVLLLGQRISYLTAVIDHSLAVASYHRCAGDLWRYFPTDTADKLRSLIP